MKSDSIKSMSSELQSLKPSELAGASNLNSDQNGQIVNSVKKKEEGQPSSSDQADSDKENQINRKRNNIKSIISPESPNELTSKIFIANIKTKIGNKVSKMIANVPRSIVYSKTFDNLKAIFNPKSALSSSSSNNISKMQINDSDSCIEIDQPIEIIKVPNKPTANKYGFNDQMLVNKLNFANNLIPQYFVKQNVNQIKEISSTNLQTVQGSPESSLKTNNEQVKDTSASILESVQSSQNGIEDELIRINNLNSSILQKFGILTKKNEFSSERSDSKKTSLGLKCNHFKSCKGKGNTNRYQNLSSHRKEKFCPLEKNKNTNKNNKNKLNADDQIRNIKEIDNEMVNSLSSEYVEIQTNGCQTDLNEIDPRIQINEANSIEIDHAETANQIIEVDECENRQEKPQIIIEAENLNSSFDLSIKRKSFNENATIYNNISSATMIFNMAKPNVTQTIKPVNINEAVDDQNTSEVQSDLQISVHHNIEANTNEASIISQTNNDKIFDIDTCNQNSSFIKNKKKCPNFNFCQGKGNSIPNRKNHWALDNCPKKTTQVDQSKNKDENYSDSSKSEEKSAESVDNSTNSNSIISNQTDDSVIKEFFSKSGITRTSSTANIKQQARKNKNGKKPEKDLKKNLDSAKKLNEELKKRCVDLQDQCDLYEFEIKKLKSLIPFDNDKKLCTTKGCIGQGNVGNENFTGYHTTVKSCPLAFIHNQNEDLITKLRTEILELKTQLNIDMPRYVNQISSLNNLNNEFMVRIDQLNSTIEEKNSEINNEFLVKKSEIEKLRRVNEALSNEKMELTYNINQLNEKYLAMLSVNTKKITNLEKQKNEQDLDFSMKFDSKLFGHKMQIEKLEKMENEIKASKSEIDRLTSQINDLNDQLLKKSQTETQSKKSFENLNRQFDDLKTEFDQITKLNDKLKESNNNLNKELKLKISQMATSIDQQSSELNNASIEINSNLLNKSNEISKLVGENEVLKAQIALFRESSNSLVLQVDEKEKEKTDQAIKLKESQEKIDELETKLKESNTKINEIIGQLTELNAVNETLNDQIKTSKNSNHFNKESVDDLKKQLKDSKAAVDELKRQIIDENLKKDEEKKQLEVAKKEIEHLNGLLLSSNSNQENLKIQLKESLDIISALKEELEKSVKNGKKQLQEFYETEKFALISKYDDQVKSLGNEINDQKIEINNLKVQLSTEKNKINKLNDQLKNSEKAVDEMQSELNKSNSNFNDATNEVESLRNQKVELTDKISSLNKNLDKANEKVNHLENQLSDFNANFERLNKELNDSDKKIGNLNDKLEKSHTIFNKELQEIHETEKIRLISIHGDQVKRLENEKSDLKKKINGLITANKRSSDMEAEQNKAETNAETLNSQLKVKNLYEQLKKSDLIIYDLKNQLNETKQRCDQLLKEKNKSLSDLEKFKTDNDHFKILIKQRKELMDSQTLEVSKLNHDLTDKTTVLEELNNKIVGLEVENKKLFDENQDFSNKVFDQDNLQTEWNINNGYTTHDKLNEFQSQIDNLKIENKKLINDFKKLSETKCDLENQILKAETNAENLKSQLIESKKSAESLNGQLNERNVKVKSLNDQLNNSDLIVEDLKRQLNQFKTTSDLQFNGLKSQLECLKIENDKLIKTKCDLQNQIFNLNASISLSSTSSLTQAEIQLNGLNDQIKELKNLNTILFEEGNRLFNEHNALKISAELIMKERNSLLREKNLLLIQLRDAENDQSLTAQKFNAEITKLKKNLSELKRKNDQSDEYTRTSGPTFKRTRHIYSDYESDSDSGDESIDFSSPIRKFCDHRLNNNWGQCPYCPRHGFKNVNVHIGHMHKCKNCKKLTFDCKCSKKI